MQVISTESLNQEEDQDQPKDVEEKCEELARVTDENPKDSTHAVIIEKNVISEDEHLKKMSEIEISNTKIRELSKKETNIIVQTSTKLSMTESKSKEENNDQKEKSEFTRQADTNENQENASATIFKKDEDEEKGSLQLNVLDKKEAELGIEEKKELEAANVGEKDNEDNVQQSGETCKDTGKISKREESGMAECVKKPRPQVPKKSRIPLRNKPTERASEKKPVPENDFFSLGSEPSLDKKNVFGI